MAKAVTLKNSSNEEVYPVTDISLVNGELNGARIVNASVGSDKLTPNAVWEENIKDSAVTPAKIDLSKLFFYKACSQAAVNITTAWVNTAISGWNLTITAEVGAIYRVEVGTGYVAYNGSSMAEVDIKLGATGATGLAHAPSTMTGTYGGGVSIGRIAVSFFTATSTNVTFTTYLRSGATGNLFRVDAGHIFVTRIG